MKDSVLNFLQKQRCDEVILSVCMSSITQKSKIAVKRSNWIFRIGAHGTVVSFSTKLDNSKSATLQECFPVFWYFSKTALDELLRMPRKMVILLVLGRNEIELASLGVVE